MRISLIAKACLAVGILLAILAGGCKRTPTAQTEAEDYLPAQGAVGFALMRLADAEGAQRWLATYTDNGRTTRFSIELQPVASPGNSPSAAKGRFVAETDSDPIPLLETLKTALQAKRLPSHVQKAEALPFDYLLVGENQSRDAAGSLRGSPPGNWMAMKVFLANDQAEVYLNLNPAIHQGEFAIKDPGYGDRVLAELAKVF